MTMLGLAGFDPQTYIHDRAEAALEEIRSTHRISVYGLPVSKFDPQNAMQFDFDPNLLRYTNGMVVMVTDHERNAV